MDRPLGPLLGGQARGARGAARRTRARGTLMAGVLTGRVTTLHIERRFAAPRERVFEAWTDPELFVRWFMPKGGSASDAEIDLRVGGSWRVTMKPPVWPAGLAFGTYMEGDPPARLVYTM